MNTLSGLLSLGAFMPHGHCYFWTKGLIALHAISDLFIVLSYFSIPLTLVYFVRRRKDLEFDWIFVCFAVFIMACGTTHLLEVWNIWHAEYWLAGSVKAVTALASVLTAILLVRLVPRALALASPAQLQQANEALRAEITQRKKTERQFRAVAESANDAIISADDAGMILGWNKGARIIFGYDEAEVLGKPLTMLMPERYRGAHLKGLERFKATGEERVIGHTVELHGLRKDGAEFPIELSLSMWEAAGTRFFSAILRDTTDRKRAEDELKRTITELGRSNAELERFAYVASHDLQEPLRAVTGCLELLASEHGPQLGSGAGELMRHAVEGAARMRTLIRDLLAYSRISTRGQPFEPTDCDAALDQALAALSAAIRESGAAITREPLPTLLADPTQLAQLFQNLIGNAIKFCAGRRPEIHVGAQRQHGGWRFSVRDNGIGIDPQYRERIFVIFQRLHTRAEFPGTGIGLAICKRIVERHGGEISCESEPCKGSTFYFSIPETGDNG